MLLPLLSLFQTGPLDAVLDDPKFQGAIVGAYVAKLDGTVLYRRNDALRMMPASNQKLLTAAFALKTLGPEHRAKTRLWKLFDRIVVDAPGDPSMTLDRLNAASKALRLNPGTPIYVKQAYRCPIPPSWEWDDLPFTYAGRVTAFAFDRGRFQLVAANGKVACEPPCSDIKIVRGPNRTGDPTFDPIKNVATVYGTLPKERKVLATFAHPQPDRQAARALGGPMFEAFGVPNGEPAFVIEGDPLSTVLGDCLIPSDNTFAENLLLMAARSGIEPGDPYPKAANLLTAFLENEVGVPKGDVRPFDGSGMSRHNLATPRALGKLLEWALKQPTADLWRKSLASPGKGTLKNRLSGIAFHGKTGTLDAVSSLSGYLFLPDGQPRIVSLVVNHYVCSGAEARAILDKFVEELARESGIGTHVEVRPSYEVRDTGQIAWPADGDRLRGPRRYRRALSARTDRRAQPAHAAPAPLKPVALLRR